MIDPRVLRLAVGAGLRACAPVALLGWLLAGCGAAGNNPDVDNGRRLYLAHGCRVCHGQEGRGDGPVGLTLNPRPRDFRDLTAYRQGTSIEEIAWTIGNGVRQKGSMMQPYAHIPEADRLLIAKYVKRLQEAK
ncbi:MAG: cytochrome c [Vicinamibacterales bacterium]